MTQKIKSMLRAAYPFAAASLIADVLDIWLPVSPEARSLQVLLGIATGILALAGFLATARSFLLINLHEKVYSTESYQDRVRARTGLKDADIYGPLKTFDKRLGFCLWCCCLAIACLWIAALLHSQDKESWPARFSAEVAFGLTIVTIFTFTRAAVSMNRNFQAIIDEWAHQARNRT